MIKRKVVELIEKHNTNDPLVIASSENIFVHSWDLDRNINGFYKYIRRSKHIFYNSNIEEELIAYVCAHELGHAILHPRANTPFMRSNTLFSVDQIEVEANRFAVELLMPDHYIYELGDTNLTINDAASIYGVPKEVSHLKEY